jgi:hypothetical protein
MADTESEEERDPITVRIAFLMGLRWVVGIFRCFRSEKDRRKSLYQSADSAGIQFRVEITDHENTGGTVPSKDVAYDMVDPSRYCPTEFLAPLMISFD